MKAMKLVRRVHLYTGLALVPFVVLYGATGFLFNHPDVWSETELSYVGADALRLDPPAAEEVAAAVVAAVDGLELDATRPPQVSGSVRLSAGRNSLSIDEQGARLFVRAPRVDSDSYEDLPVEWDGADELVEQAEQLIPESGWRVRSLPRVEFGVRRGDQELDASYDLRQQELTVRERSPRSIRSFLLRLHKAHVYPTGYGVDFWWSVVVDVMGITMVAWALSGLMMWWQMKKLRRGGLVALALCAVGTTLLVLGKWG